MQKKSGKVRKNVRINSVPIGPGFISVGHTHVGLHANFSIRAAAGNGQETLCCGSFAWISIN